MKLPKPTARATAGPHWSRATHISGAVTPAAKVYVTGSAVCKKGQSVIDTDSATVCGNESAFHDHCTAAKNAAALKLRPRCQQAGGISFPSGSCTNDGKC